MLLLGEENLPERGSKDDGLAELGGVERRDPQHSEFRRRRRHRGPIYVQDGRVKKTRPAREMPRSS